MIEYNTNGFDYGFAKSETNESQTANEKIKRSVSAIFILTIPLPSSESRDCQGGTQQIINIVYVC